MKNKRTLLVGGVYLIPGRLKHASPLMVEICDEFDPELLQHEYVKDAPFDTVSLIFRFGEEDVFDPDIGDINNRHSELPVAIMFNLERLKDLDRSLLREEFRTATLEVLCDVAANFDLPFEFLDRMRAQA